MGADSKTLRTRIKSVDSTLHLTKAMGLVASSKMRRAKESMQKSQAYVKNFEAVTELLAACPECKKSPYLRSSGDRTRCIVIAGDRGLAGGYNANVFRLSREYPAAEFIPIGKRACEHFNKAPISSETFSAEDALKMAKTLCRDFTEGKYDRLGIIGTRFVSMMTQEAVMRWVLPLSVKDTQKKDTSVIFEPDEATILDLAIPEYVAGILVMSVRESFASEVAARRMAMDSAEKNAHQMIEDLQLQYNRARQSVITQEITEIIAGSGT